MQWMHVLKSVNRARRMSASTQWSKTKGRKSRPCTAIIVCIYMVAEGCHRWGSSLITENRSFITKLTSEHLNCTLDYTFHGPCIRPIENYCVIYRSARDSIPGKQIYSVLNPTPVGFLPQKETYNACFFFYKFSNDFISWHRADHIA